MMKNLWSQPFLLLFLYVGAGLGYADTYPFSDADINLLRGIVRSRMDQSARNIGKPRNIDPRPAIRVFVESKGLSEVDLSNGIMEYALAKIKTGETNLAFEAVGNLSEIKGTNTVEFVEKLVHRKDCYGFRAPAVYCYLYLGGLDALLDIEEMLQSDWFSPLERRFLFQNLGSGLREDSPHSVLGDKKLEPVYRRMIQNSIFNEKDVLCQDLLDVLLCRNDITWEFSQQRLELLQSWLEKEKDGVRAPYFKDQIGKIKERNR